MNDADSSAGRAATAAVQLSVVMPAYNEEAAIEAAVQEVERQVFGKIGASELIAVDDGSRDHTGKILDQLAAREARIKVIHQPNGGHGSALRTGLDAARGEYLLLIDSDRQIPLQAFDALWKAALGHDGAFGVRRTRHDPWIRLLLSWMVGNALRVLFNVQLRDANVPFKLIRRSIWLEARRLIPEETVAPSIFLAIIARRLHDIVEVDVPHRERTTGVVSIQSWKLLAMCTRGFRQLWAFRKKLEA